MKILLTAAILVLGLAANAKVDLSPYTVEAVFGNYLPNKSLHTTLYVGGAKGISGDLFIERLESHVDLVTNIMRSRGLVSYTVYATESNEVAVMQWESEAAANQAFAEAGEPVLKDGSQFLELKIWETMNVLPAELSLEFFENSIPNYN